MKKKLFYFICLLLVFQIFNCNNNSKNYYICILNYSKSPQIILTNLFATQNNSEVKNIFSFNYKKIFKTNSVNEIIGADLLDSVFISNFKLISSDIDSIQLFANNIFIGNFPTNSKIELNLNLKSFWFVSKPRNIFYLDTYIDSIQHKFLHPNYNKTFIINKLCLWNYKNKLIKYDFEENNFANDSIVQNTMIFNFLDTLFLDNSNSHQSIFLNSKGNIFAINKNDSINKIFIGNYSVENKTFLQTNCFANGKLFEIVNNKTVQKNYSGNLILNNKKIVLDSLINIFVKIPDEAFVTIKSLDTNIVLDIRYATENNFTKTKLYDCEQCMLRYAVAKDLAKANLEFMKCGVRIKIFDGYRPHYVQYKMWEVVPNVNYVANPAVGSIHNRGGAIDVSLVDSLNQDVDLGTDYDFFGKEAFHNYQNFSDTILQNRLLLKNILQQNNFMAIKTEWWHYSHRLCMMFEISNFKLPCEK